MECKDIKDLIIDELHKPLVVTTLALVNALIAKRLDDAHVEFINNAVTADSHRGYCSALMEFEAQFTQLFTDDTERARFKNQIKEIKEG